jgi:predicted  nucleic acid-binding Zn-ribbon protein
MGLKEDNAGLVRENGRLAGVVETAQAQLIEVQGLLAQRTKEYEALLKQAGELNEISNQLNRETDDLRYKIPQLERQITDLISHNSTLLDLSNRFSETVRDLAAAVKALTQN